MIFSKTSPGFFAALGAATLALLLVGAPTATYAAPTNPVIVSGAPPSGTVGVPYLFAVVATGEPVPILSADPLPPGLSFDPVLNLIFGIPSSVGSFSVTITADNGLGFPDIQTFPLEINVGQTLPTPPVFLASDDPPTGMSGVQYSYTIETSSDTPVTYTITQGSLPPGLSLDPSTGVVSGTPTVPGSYTITVEADNGTDPAPTKTFSFEIIAVQAPPEPPVFLASDDPPTGMSGVQYSYTIETSSDTPVTYTITQGSLPPGLSLDPSTGVVSGTPTVPGSYTITVEADNGTDPAPTKTFSFEIIAVQAPPEPPVFLASDDPPTGMSGVQYSYTIETSSDTPVTYTITQGSLPPGLSLDPSTGVVSGTPTVPGSYTITVEADNGTDPAPTKTFSFEIIAVQAPPEPPVFLASDDPPTGMSGVQYSYTIETSSDTPVTYTITQGSLPPGLSLDPSTGVVSGTPTVPGSYTITVEADNGTDPAPTKTFTFNIAAVPTNLTSGLSSNSVSTGSSSSSGSRSGSGSGTLVNTGLDLTGLWPIGGIALVLVSAGIAALTLSGRKRAQATGR